MEHSIDLQYMIHISFNDPILLKEILEEWKLDTNNRIEDLTLHSASEIETQRFRIVHMLKANFFMVGCKEMIKECEDYLNDEITTENTEILIVKMKTAYIEICRILSKEENTN